nr:PREDICTED: fas-activated serine/threonine kinase [Latimeria chalumnae]|eukprot:XP_005994284.2 PREDICTED: fas-activated serine/threonine kinase [Latimeria chalumnae]
MCVDDKSIEPPEVQNGPKTPGFHGNYEEEGIKSLTFQMIRNRSNYPDPKKVVQQLLNENQDGIPHNIIEFYLPEELPKKVESITPYTMALVAKYIARHRLRETQLLDTIAEFLVKKAEYLDSKVIQKLVFPFSRMNYRPSNEDAFFEKLESVLELKAMNSPLATVNIIMSMFQLGHFPRAILNQVFSPAFINNVINSPYALIVRRYLSLLDSAVELEYEDYSGPRLEERYKVMMFDHALTADEVNRKYSYKGLVAEALRQLVGEQCYKQDEVLPPGYYTDFLLWINNSGSVVNINGNVQGSSSPLCPVASSPQAKPTESPTGSLHSGVAALTSDFQKFSPFAHENLNAEGQEKRIDGNLVTEVSFLSHIRPPSGMVGRGNSGATLLSSAAIEYSPYYPPSDYYTTLGKDQSLESQESSSLSSPSDCLAQPTTAAECSPVMSSATLFQFPIGKILEEEAPKTAVPPPLGQEHNLFGCDQPVHGFYNNVAYQENEVGTEKGVMGQVEILSPSSPLQLTSPNHADNERREETECTDTIKRVVMSVNDKWHYCHNADILVGSRAMRDRHLRLLGYTIVQLPYHELEKLNGIEEVKHYLREKLLELQL